MSSATHIRRLDVCAIAVAVLLLVAFGVQLAVAQSPDEEYVPEPGYLDAPGDIGYGVERPAVSGEQEDCDLDPGDPRCPAPAPHTIALPVVEFTTTSVNLSAQYTRVVWGITNQHYYKFELHRSRTATGTYALSATVWDERTPVNFNGVSRRYYYKIRAKRCRLPRNEVTCGDWGSYSPYVYVPEIATGLELTRDMVELTATYTAAGRSWDVINRAEREIDSEEDPEESDYDIDGSGYDWDGDRGNEYRFQIKRCTDPRRRSCDSWSAWSPWAKIPNFAPKATGLSLRREGQKIIATYGGEGESFDIVHVFRRRVGHTRIIEVVEARRAKSGYDTVVQRDNHYRFRVKRCTDQKRKDCGGDDNWSVWSAWLLVPNLPTLPGKPTITVSDDDLTVTYTATGTGTSHDDYQFQQSSSELSGFADYTDGTLSGNVLSNVERGRWYQASVRRCTDEGLADCTAWSEYSEPKRVAPALEVSSGADGKSVVADFISFPGHMHTLKLYASSDGKRYDPPAVGTATPTGNTTSHTFKGLIGGSGRTYLARLSACPTGTPSNCTNHESAIISLTKAPAPSISGITLANEDDLTVGYTLPTWNYGSGDVLDFEIKREESSSGMFDTDYTHATTPPGMPHKFNDVHTGYYYKARGRRCSDSALTICGDWSGLSSAVNVPALSALLPPSNIRVSIVSHKEVQASFVQSTRPSQTTHRYVFEVGRSASQTGSFAYSDGVNVGTATKVSFSGLDADKWYKVRGKRCDDPARKRCGSWTESTNAVETVSPDPKLKVVSSTTTITIDAGLRKPIFVDATGLDQTKQYLIQFQSSEPPETPMNPEAPESAEARAARLKARVLKFEKCDAANPRDWYSQPVPARADRFRASARTFFGCFAGSDTVTMNLVQGEETVATVELTVNVRAVPKPEELRADGNNRGNDEAVKFEIAWKGVDRATGYELRYAEECVDRGILCSRLESTWLTPASVSGAGGTSYTVTVESADGDTNNLYRVQMSAVRNGARSQWSDPVFVHPSGSPPTGKVATIPFYGHHADRNYTYRLCEGSFPKTLSQVERAEWASIFESGIQEWELRMNWHRNLHGEDRQFVSTMRDTTSIGDFGAGSCHDLDDPPVILVPTGDPSFPYLPVVLPLNNPYAEIRFAHPAVLMHRCTAWGIGGVPDGCAPHSHPLESLTTFNPGLLINRAIPHDVDILLSSENQWVPGLSAVPKKCSRLKQFVIHEVGHALGVSASHTHFSMSIMQSSVPNDICTPDPYDIAAMLTNYQALGSE